jgi:hypothetical protein
MLNHINQSFLRHLLVNEILDTPASRSRNPVPLFRNIQWIRLFGILPHLTPRLCRVAYYYSECYICTHLQEVTRQTAPLKCSICIHGACVLFDRELRFSIQWRILPIFAVQSVPTEHSDKVDSSHDVNLGLENCYTYRKFFCLFPNFFINEAWKYYGIADQRLCSIKWR